MMNLEENVNKANVNLHMKSEIQNKEELDPAVYVKAKKIYNHLPHIIEQFDGAHNPAQVPMKILEGNSSAQHNKVRDDNYTPSFTENDSLGYDQMNDSVISNRNGRAGTGHPTMS